MKKAFLLVGHSNWGKSETLYQLAENNRRKKYYLISGEWFIIRRMSNDDNEESLERFIDSADKYGHHLIIAFCPTFRPGEKAHKMLKKTIRKFRDISFRLRI